MISFTCHHHPGVELKVTSMHGHKPMKDGVSTAWHIDIEPCPKCLADADAHGYEVGEADGRHQANLAADLKQLALQGKVT